MSLDVAIELENQEINVPLFLGLHSHPTFSVVIPWLNEAKNVPFVLPKIPEWVDEIIVICGRSTDDTVVVAMAPCRRQSLSWSPVKAKELRCAMGFRAKGHHCNAGCGRLHWPGGDPGPAFYRRITCCIITSGFQRFPIGLQNTQCIRGGRQSFYSLTALTQGWKQVSCTCFVCDRRGSFNSPSWTL